MKWTLIGSWYLVALATFLICFVGFLKAGWIFDENGNVSWGMILISIIIFIALFIGATCGVSFQSKKEKDKIAEELYEKKDKPVELVKTIKRIGEIVDSSKDFDTAIAYKNGKPTIGIKPKSGVPLKVDIGAKFDTKERGEEFKKFLFGENSHFEFSKEELKKFKVVVGKTVVESVEKGKLVLDEVFPSLPPMKIKTEYPKDKEYSCFDYIQFETKQMKDGFVYWDNEKQDRSVTIALAFNLSTGETKFPLDFVKVNRKSKNYNIDHEIDFYKFQKSLLSNAKLVFINLKDNSTISKTDHFIPVNVDSGASFRSMEAAINLFQQIKKIQDKFNLKFKIPEEIKPQDLGIIEYAIAAIDGKEIKIDFEVFEFETSYEQALKSVETPEISSEFDILLDTKPIVLFDETIKLGKLQAMFPPCKVVNTLEQLELIKDKTKPVTIILKPLKSNAQFIGHFVDYIKSDKTNITFIPNK